MISITTLQNNLRIWAVAQVTSGVEVVFADQNVPAPAETYVTVKIASTARIGQGHVGPIDDNTGQAEVRGTREIIVRLNAMGTGAAEQLELIVGSLEDPAVLITLQRLKIAFVNQLSNVVDLTGVIGPEREERATVDLKFRISTPYAASPSGADVGVIDHVHVTNQGTGDTFIVNP